MIHATDMPPKRTRRGDVMGIGELSEGMRVRMPSGQILTVTEIAEPDKDGVVRMTCSAEEEPGGE